MPSTSCVPTAGAGRGVPVTGFDDIAEATPAGLTTIRQPGEAKGRSAATLLLDPPVDAAAGQILLPTTLVVEQLRTGSEELSMEQSTGFVMAVDAVTRHVMSARPDAPVRPDVPRPERWWSPAGSPPGRCADSPTRSSRRRVLGRSVAVKVLAGTFASTRTCGPPSGGRPARRHAWPTPT